ncbi:MAG: HNH endonuclease [Nitrososphaerales archaeon]
METLQEWKSQRRKSSTCNGCQSVINSHWNKVADIHSPRKIHTHHIIPIRFGGEDTEENKIKLCSKCHSKIHKKYADEAIKLVFSTNKNFFANCLLNREKNG